MESPVGWVLAAVGVLVTFLMFGLVAAALGALLLILTEIVADVARPQRPE